ncbi:hypothetical protein HDR58_10780 [bacterium]|nr:hypothetical protein [bacterium]
MNIQSQPSFTARVKINDIKNIATDSAIISPYLSSGSSGVASTAAGSLGTTASKLVGSASDVLGTAFSAKASGMDSSGIVPSAIDAVTPYVTPKTIASANNHPSVMGSIFSTIGNFFSNICKVTKKDVKDPS